MNAAPIDPVPRLTNRRGAGRYLAVCPRTIANMVRRGELAEVHIGSRRLYDIADLDRLIEERKTTGILTH